MAGHQGYHGTTTKNMNNVTEASHMKRPLLLLGLRLGRVKPMGRPHAIPA